MELFAGALWSSEPHHAKADVSLEVGKQHLDLSPLGERSHVGVDLADFPREIAGDFVNGADDLARGLARAAPGAQRAASAVLLRRAIADQSILIARRCPRLGEVSPIGLERLAVGQAEVSDVGS